MVDLRTTLQALAAQGVHVGTSSWKYPGWLGQVYIEERYHTRGKFSRAKFDATCLEEYAGTFSTVCVDAGYYTFPRPEWLAGMASQVPDGFRFAFKVPEDITVRRFTNLPRYGPKAGKDNPHFLDAELFTRAFPDPLAHSVINRLHRMQNLRPRLPPLGPCHRALASGGNGGNRFHFALKKNVTGDDGSLMLRKGAGSSKCSTLKEETSTSPPWLPLSWRGRHSTRSH